MLKNKKVLIGIIVTLLVAVIFVILYFALRTDKTYVITFNTDGGSKIESIKAKENENIKLPINPTKEGYTFNGWENETGEVVSNDYIVTKNITLKAIWLSEKAETITISFDTDGGSKIDDISLERGTELKLPEDPTKEGYIFKGWVDKNETPIYDKALLAQDTKLKAVWEKEEKKETTKKEYYCPEGYKLNGRKCSKIESINANSTASCPTGTIESGSNCLKTNETKALIRTCKPYENYSTGAYSSAANGCFYGEKGPAGIDKYTCENNLNGIYNNGHCYTVLKQGSNYYTLSCENGYEKYTPNNSNPICAKIIEKDVSYSCNDGYTLSGTKCTKTVTVEAKVR